MHLNPLFLVLALGSTNVAAYRLTGDPVLIASNYTKTDILPAGVAPINITTGTYAGFKDLYPDCSIKTATTFYEAYASQCERYFNTDKFQEATRACICQHIWGPTWVSPVGEDHFYERDLSPRVEKDCNGDKEGLKRTQDLEYQTHDYCSKMPYVDKVSAGTVNAFRDSGVTASVSVGKETVGVMLATSIVAFFISF